MKIRLFFLVLSVLPLSVHAESLDIKTGLWEIVMSTAVTGVPIPAAALANMPAEQRAKFEASMRARAGKVNTRTFHQCLTKEDIDRNKFIESEQENCKRNIVEQNARRVEVEETCGAPEPTKTHMTYAAKTPENYTTTMDREQGEGGKVHVEMSGRWIAAACSKADED
jgi:hypothetical protein